MAVKSVIFDFDGTIVDSLPALLRMYEGVRGNPRAIHPAVIDQYRSKSMYRIPREMDLSMWQIAYLAIWGRRLFRKHLRSIKVFKGMDTLIRDLYKNEVKLFVVSTNRTENVEKYLQWHGLFQYFDGVYGGASFLSKAWTMRRLVRREGLDVNQVWCVGDEKIDIVSAHNAGLKVVSVSWGYAGREGLRLLYPNRLVDTVDELRKIVLRGSR